MSGFEIAGVVLGAFPIAIEGLNYYKKQQAFWENWREIRREYEMCLNNLKVQQTLFSFNLRHLLLPLVAEPQRIEALIIHPGSQEWADPELEQALRQRLDGSYDAYMKSICSMRALMENATKYLGIESIELPARLLPMEDNAGVHTSRSTAKKRNVMKEFMFQKARLRFTMGQADREKFFVKLQMWNKTLQELLESSDRILSLGRHVLTGRYAGSSLDADICEFWQHAQGSYKAFSEAWTCPCRYQHQTEVMLQHRRTNDKEMRLILREPTSDGNSISFGHGVAIREALDTIDPEQEQPYQALGQSQTSPSSYRSRSTRHTSSATSAKSGIESQTLRKGKGVYNAAVNRGIVTNLCSKIMTGFNSDHHLEYLQSDGHKYYIFSRTRSGNGHGLQRLSLEKILRGSEPNITRQQRYAISLNLVSSFIQLRETPWITSSWHKSSIVFPEQRGYPDTSDLQEPFLTHRLKETPASNCDSNVPLQDFSSLAVTLLELSFGKVIEDHPERPRLPPEVVENASMKAAFDAYAAKLWLEDVTADVGPDYRNAIAWCLSKHLTLCGPEWRQEMLQHVIRPLNEIMKPWTSQFS